VNWKEAPVAAYPDEPVRIAAISARVAAWLEDGVDVVCLQEVSGDQLASLRRALGVEAHVFEHLYPRLPRLRDGGAPVLDDASEHLVTLVSSRGARQVGARTFDTDPGKGVLVVELDAGVRALNTHVSFGPRRDAQLLELAEGATAAGGAVVVGDFNAPVDAVQAGLGPTFSLSDLRGQRATRVATAEHPGRVIDHIAVHRGVIESASVLDDEALSDHAPVAATVRFATTP
jgi:endonuclease/exonuclease/phosphatase family metal-dependent hydrolase